MVLMDILHYTFHIDILLILIYKILKKLKAIIYMSLCKFPEHIQPVQTNPFKLCKIKRESLSVPTQSRFHIF
jgi:hypothetical protein